MELPYVGLLTGSGGKRSSQSRPQTFLPDGNREAFQISLPHRLRGDFRSFNHTQPGRPRPVVVCVRFFRNLCGYTIFVGGLSVCRRGRKACASWMDVLEYDDPPKE